MKNYTWNHFVLNNHIGRFFYVMRRKSLGDKIMQKSAPPREASRAPRHLVPSNILQDITCKIILYQAIFAVSIIIFKLCSENSKRTE